MRYRGSLVLPGRDLEERGICMGIRIPFTGRPVMNGGFINWNTLVFDMTQELM